MFGGRPIRRSLLTATPLCAVVVLAAANLSKPPRPITQPMQLINFGNYQLQAPPDWPVFDLDAEPQRCMRLDQHAVYLGNPGPDQNCPAHLIGRTETIHIQRLSDGLPNLLSSGKPSITNEDGEIRGTFPVENVSVTVTYSADSQTATKLMNAAIPSRYAATVTPTAAGQPPTPATLGSSPTSLPAPSVTTPSVPSQTAPLLTVPPLPTQSTTELAETPKRKPVINPQEFAGRGFDACTAPSLNAMAAWRPAYGAIGIYIGGVNRACSQGNLNATWVKKVSQQGYRFIPTFVGLQAPCTPQKWAKISSPDREGKEAADNAATQMRKLGFGANDAVYLDVESYHGDKDCQDKVRAYISAWVNQLHQHGFAAGVYSGAASGIKDLTKSYWSPRYTRPDAIWFAHWDEKANVFKDSYFSDVFWAKHQRLKQYLGGHEEKHGKFTINIDTNQIDGPVSVPLSNRS